MGAADSSGFGDGASGAIEELRVTVYARTATGPRGDRATDSGRYDTGRATRVPIQRRSTSRVSVVSDSRESACGGWAVPRIGMAPSIPPTGELSPDGPGEWSSIR